MDIALCTDEHFAIPALVCITSILENNQEEICHITVLTSGLSISTVNKFSDLAKYYEREISIKTIDQSYFKGMITHNRYPLPMYFRFLLPKVLKDADRVLYLDCDTIIRGTLREMYCTDLSGRACAVVEDQQCDDVEIINRLNITSPYFNSGVMLLNLDYWRNNHITSDLLLFIKANPQKCVYPDQDALNVVLEGKVKYLPYIYNCQEMWITMRSSARIHYSKWLILDEAIKNPVIVHFCVGDKPWFEECNNPFQEDFLKYANLHLFLGFKIKKKYSYLYHIIVAWEMRFHRWSQKFINQ